MSTKVRSLDSTNSPMMQISFSGKEEYLLIALFLAGSNSERKVVRIKDKLAQNNEDSWNLSLSLSPLSKAPTIVLQGAYKGLVFCVIKLNALTQELEMLEEK